MSEKTFRTHPHQRVEKALDKMGVHYQSEVDTFPPYQLDLYLPDHHVCIEVDGPAHLKRKDAVRDQWMLERYGVPTLRIKAKGQWQSQAHLEESIMAFLEETSQDYKERRNIWLTLRSML